MTGLQKHVIFLVALLLTVCLCASAVAEGVGDDAWLLRLVNAAHPMGEDDVPNGLVKLVARRNGNKGENTNDGLYMASSGSIQLVSEAAEALKDMLNAAEEDGVVLYVRQGYRSYADEARAYERLKDRDDSARKPGENDYQTGLAVSLVTKEWRAKVLSADFGDTPEAQWLASNCSRFGFILRYPQGKQDVTGFDWEPWHFRYVGGAAEEICLNHLTLEEYCAEKLGMELAAPAVTEEPGADEPDDQSADEPDESADETDGADESLPELAAAVTPAPAPAASHADVEDQRGMIETWLLCEANARHPMGKDDVPANLVKLVSRRNDDDGRSINDGLHLASSNSVQLVEEAADALKRMLVAAEDSGFEIYVRQGYRSYEDEARAYERMQARGEKAPKPGECDYQTGLAVTLVTRDWRAKSLTAEFGDTPEAQWLASNCSRYGFILRYPEGKQDVTGFEWEPWHFRYVGRDAAEVMRLNHLALEEFCAGIGLDSDTGDVIPMESLPYATPMILPDGPIVLDETGEDGDHEIILFHD